MIRLKLTNLLYLLGILFYDQVQSNKFNTVPSVVVELAIICDYEYSYAFNFDQDEITSYWFHEIEDLEVQFQTLPSVNVTFSITSVKVINNTDDQPYIEESRDGSNTADIERITNKFSTWAYQNIESINADVVFLITGSKGKYRADFGLNKACQMDHSNKTFSSFVVFRSGCSHKDIWWHSRWDLAAGMAELLGATTDAYTSCAGSATIMDSFMQLTWLKSVTKSMFYFSVCSFKLINSYLSSNLASCLYETTHNIDTSLESRVPSLTPSMLNQCKHLIPPKVVKYQHIVTVGDLQDSCGLVECLALEFDESGKPTGGKIPFPPTANSPCGDLQVCFRGQCIRKGYIFQNVNFKHCLLASGKFVEKNTLYLLDYPQTPKRFEEFQLLDNANEGLYIATLDPFPFNKCLTVDSDDTHVLLVSCPTTFQKRFLWELFDVGDGSQDILLCHRKTMKCAITDKSGVVTVTSITNLFDPLYRWTFRGTQNLTLEDSQHLRNIDEISAYIEHKVSIGLPAYNFNVTILCDRNFSSFFRYNDQGLTNFWTHQFMDLNILFGTLRSTSITFSVTSITVINETAQPSFPKLHFDFDNANHAQANMVKIANWVHKSKYKFNANVVIFATGSTGIEAIRSGLFRNCDKENLSIWAVTILRLGTSGWWHIEKVLANQAAELLGAKNDEDTSCKGEGYALDNDAIKDVTKAFFSSCTDSAIHQHLVSSKDTCLTNVRGQPKTKAVQSSSIYPDTLEHVCDFLLPGSVPYTVSASKDFSENKHGSFCFGRTCVLEREKNVRKGDILFPLYNTPCGPNKFCFRHRCLEKGFLLKNEESGLCLASSDSFAYNDSLQLTNCQNLFSRQNELLPVKAPGIGHHIRMPYTTTEQNDKCLAVTPDSKLAKFDKCPSADTPEFVWDLVEVTDGSAVTLLCHRMSKACAVAGDEQNVIHLQPINELSLLQRWNPVRFSGAVNFSDVPTTKLEDIIQFYGLDVVIHVAVFCDRECATLFGNIIEDLQVYWNVLLFDVYSKYKSIPDVIVDFNVTSVQFVNVTMSANYSSRKMDGLDTNERLKKWVATEYPRIKFDIAVILTGSLGIRVTRKVEPDLVCESSKTNGTLFASIMIKMGNPNSNWWSDIAGAFGEILGSNSKLSGNCKEAEPEKMNNSTKQPYYFSNSQRQRIRKFLASKAAFCLRKGNRLKPTYFPYQTTSLSVPNITSQCRIFTGYTASYAVPKAKMCEAINCYQVKKSSASLIGQVHPLPYTPCGVNKHCFGGRCISKGNQIENVASGLCLRSVNNFWVNDTIKTDRCLKVSSPLEDITVVNNGPNGILLKSYYISYDGNASAEKCLTVNDATKQVHFTTCPEINTDSFGWEMTNTTNIPTGKVVCVSSLKMIFMLALGAVKIAIRLTAGNILINQMTQVKAHFQIRSENMDLMVTLIIAICTSVGLVAVTGGGYLVFRQWRLYGRNKLAQEMFYRGDMTNLSGDGNVSDQAVNLPFDRSWEFPITHLTFGKDLGSGAFGRVISAKAIGIRDDETATRVAVKTLQTEADVEHFEALKRELKILSHLGTHPNLVNLLGACTKYIGNNELWVILEFCKYGSIRSYLISHQDRFLDQMNSTYEFDITVSRPVKADLYMDLKDFQPRKDKSGGTSSGSIETRSDDVSVEILYNGDYNETLETPPLKTEDLLLWAHQIARGMNYLTSKRVLHGDLATRNILLAENNVVKICDFGFSKELRKNYEYNYKKETKGALLPIRWMALESIEFGLFSAESDCWSYGVVLWEIFSLGKSPYPGVFIDKSFPKRLKEGMRMDKPDYAPSRVYDIMLQCWDLDKSARPKFGELVEVFGNILGDNNRPKES